MPGILAQPGIQVPGDGRAEDVRGDLQLVPARVAAAGDGCGEQELGLHRAGLVHQHCCGLHAGKRLGRRGPAAGGAVVLPGRERLAGQGGGVQAVKVPGDDDRGRCGPYLLPVEAGDVFRGEMGDGGGGAFGGPARPPSP